MTIYTLGNQDCVLNLLKQRTLEHEGAFILPYIKNKTKILDYGCGLASISRGIHKHFRDIKLVGVDIDYIVLREAGEINKSLKSTSFTVADILSIPFSNESFNLVFGNTILMQLSKPILAIQELKRALKPNGIIAIREPNYKLDEYSHKGFVYKFWGIFCEMLIREGGNPYIGSEIIQVLVDHDFEILDAQLVKKRVISSSDFNKVFINFVKNAKFIQRSQTIGLISEHDKEILFNNILKEIEDPDFFYKRSYYEIIAKSKQ